MNGEGKPRPATAGRTPLLTIIRFADRISADSDESAPGEGLVEWLASPAAPDSTSPYEVQPVVGEYRPGRTGSRLNVAISLARGDWIAVLFGDEVLQAGWLAQLCRRLNPDGICQDRDILVCRSVTDRCLPLLVVRRQAFVYGALDAGFECERLVLWHWLYQIYEGRRSRVLPSSGAVEQGCDWLGMKTVPGALSGAMNAMVGFGSGIDPDVRLALLDSALASPEATIAELATMRRDAAARADERGAVSPYLSGEYRPRRFWEENTRGYVRWEAYQPDEAEIVEVASRLRPASVLELGCGVGRNARYFSAADRYSGIDISSNLLQRSFERREANWLGNVCGTITRLPFADASWDLVFGDSTVQHVVPGEIEACIAEILRVSGRYICLIEYTAEEAAGGSWFSQVHMFPHDYKALFAPHCNLLWHTETSLHVHPARKEVFLFEKR